MPHPLHTLACWARRSRGNLAFSIWAALAAIFILVSVGFMLAAAFMEVTH